MRCLRYVLVLSLVLLSAGIAAQTPPSQASGHFASRQRKFTTAGAYAFPEEVGMAKEPGVIVAVSNARFVPIYFDRIWDRAHVIDSIFRDEETFVVYFHFARSGAYKGLSYYFGSGDGCGFCFDGTVQSSVKLEGSRIHGTIKQPKDDTTFEVTFDVPVAPADYGQALPAGGGEPGKAYAAAHAALVEGSVEAVKPVLSADNLEDIAEHGEALVRSFREQHPTKSYTIVRGWSRDGHALLLVEGETPYMNVRTEAHLVLENGTWRLDDEFLQIRLEP